jgi:alkyl sulfatase BDS1-like metallo-beta-lactamase superfamily hydrolase
MDEKIKKRGIITAGTGIVFKNPIEDVHTAEIPIAGCAWIDTKDGVVLIDTLLFQNSAEKVMERIKGKIKYIIYTHGHYDHVSGTRAFMRDNPEVIASKHLPARLDRYEFLAPYRGLITAMQFNVPKADRSIQKVVRPTKTFLGDMTFTLGDKTFELHTARAETDDACWLHVPELNAVFIGDLIIKDLFPNIGNPWKPTRYALDWAKELERVRALDPEYVFCNGAAHLFKGKHARGALDANIEVIRSMHDQVVEYINQDMHITEMIHKVKIPEHLMNSPYLNPFYSRPEFFTFNVYRWYHGYYDHNPAHLLPRPEKEVMKEIYSLIGDPDKIINRANDLFAQNQAQLALEVLDVLLQAEPENIEALQLRMQLTNDLGKDDKCLMSRNAYLYSGKQDKRQIRKIKKTLKKNNRSK